MSGLKFLMIPLVLSLAGCVSYYQPRYADDGVYYEQQQSYRQAYVDPMVYPYWSLDYFYFSRYYFPYSVVVHYYDPWYYPYPGWYYGYRHGRYGGMAIGVSGYYYPWYSYGYHGHRPWHPHWISYPRRQHRPDQYATLPPAYQRVRQIDERLRELERRQQVAHVRAARPDTLGDPGMTERIDSRGAADDGSDSRTDQQQRERALRRAAARDRTDRTGLPLPTSRPSLPTRPAVTGQRQRSDDAQPRRQAPRPREERHAPRELRQIPPSRPAPRPESSPPQPPPARSAPPVQRQPAPPPSPPPASPPPRRSDPPPQRSREGGSTRERRRER